MKKYILVLFAVILFYQLPFSAFAYPGGLMNGKGVRICQYLYSCQQFVSEVTDNNTSTYYDVPPGYSLQHELSDVYSISSYRLLADSNLELRFERVGFSYDVVYNPVITGVSSNVNLSFKDIAKIILYNNSASTVRVYELDVFGLPYDNVPPTVPTNLVGESSPFSITLSWDASHDNTSPNPSGLKGYEIYRDYFFLASTKNTTYEDKFVTTGKIYNYEVRAVDNNDNKSAFSNTLTISPIKITPPAVPTHLTAVPGVEQITLNWDINTTDSDFSHFNVYKNSQKINDAPVIVNSFLVSDLPPDVNYTFQVSAVDTSGNESNKSQSVISSALSKPLFPTINYEDLNATSVRLLWDKVAPSFEIFVNGELYETVSTPFVFITKLNQDTFYDFQVIAIDKYGRRNASNILSLQTIVNPPLKPSLKVSNKSHDAFTVSWSADPNATEFDVYLNDEFVGSTSDSSYSFSNLTSDTLYAFKVVVKGPTGTSQSSGSVRTDSKPVPMISSAKLSPVPGQPNHRNLEYTANSLVTAVKVFLDGNFVGEYPVSQGAIQLDFSEFQDQPFTTIRVEPSDPDGKAFEYQALTKSSGDGFFDQMIAKFSEIFTTNKVAFWVLALAAIPLSIALFAFFWIRRKFKRMFGESKIDEIKLINQPVKPTQEIIDSKEEKRKFIPWKEMSEEQRNEWRQKKGLKPKFKSLTDKDKLEFRSMKHEEKTGFKIVKRQVKKVPLGFFGSGGLKTKEDLTYERNGVQYKKRFVRGQGMVYQPKDFSNKVKHVSNQFKAVKAVFTGSNKKFN